MKKLALTFTLLFGALFFVLLFSPVATADENSDDPALFGIICWQFATEGDTYGRVYPINYHIDVDGAGTRLAATEHAVTDIGTSEAGAVEGGYGVQGRIACYQISPASGAASVLNEIPARTIPVVCSGYDSMTFQLFSCPSIGYATDTIYTATGTADCTLEVRGSLFPSPDSSVIQANAGRSDITPVTAFYKFLDVPVPIQNFSNEIPLDIPQGAHFVVGATEVTQNGSYQVDIRGLHSVAFSISGNSATKCIVARFNRNFVIDAAASRSYDYPAP